MLWVRVLLWDGDQNTPGVGRHCYNNITRVRQEDERTGKGLQGNDAATGLSLDEALTKLSGGVHRTAGGIDQEESLG